MTTCRLPNLGAVEHTCICLPHPTAALQNCDLQLVNAWYNRCTSNMYQTPAAAGMQLKYVRTQLLHLNPENTAPSSQGHNSQYKTHPPFLSSLSSMPKVLASFAATRVITSPGSFLAALLPLATPATPCHRAYNGRRRRPQAVGVVSGNVPMRA